MVSPQQWSAPPNNGQPRSNGQPYAHARVLKGQSLFDQPRSIDQRWGSAVLHITSSIKNVVWYRDARRIDFLKLVCCVRLPPFPTHILFRDSSRADYLHLLGTVTHAILALGWWGRQFCHSTSCIKVSIYIASAFERLLAKLKGLWGEQGI